MESKPLPLIMPLPPCSETQIKLGQRVLQRKHLEKVKAKDQRNKEAVKRRQSRDLALRTTRIPMWLKVIPRRYLSHLKTLNRTLMVATHKQLMLL